jgi:hypothetical protein
MFFSPLLLDREIVSVVLHGIQPRVPTAGALDKFSSKIPAVIVMRAFSPRLSWDMPSSQPLTTCPECTRNLKGRPIGFLVLGSMGPVTKPEGGGRRERETSAAGIFTQDAGLLSQATSSYGRGTLSRPLERRYRSSVSIRSSAPRSKVESNFFSPARSR